MSIERSEIGPVEVSIVKRHSGIQNAHCVFTREGITPESYK
jgi:hypothetical protein